MIAKLSALHFIRRDIVNIVAFVGLFATSFNFFFIWFIAFFSDYEVVIAINYFNEAYPELIINIILIIAIILWCKDYLNSLSVRSRLYRKNWYRRNGVRIPIDTL